MDYSQEDMMQNIFKLGTALTVAELTTKGELMDNILKEASSRAEDIANFLEEIEQQIPKEESND